MLTRENYTGRLRLSCAHQEQAKRLIKQKHQTGNPTFALAGGTHTVHVGILWHPCVYIQPPTVVYIAL